MTFTQQRASSSSSSSAGAAPASPAVVEERSGGVLTIRLNRPQKLNALDLDICRLLVHSLLRGADDKSVRVIVLTGAGRGFCAGGDLNFIREARNRRAAGDLEAMLLVGKEICLAIATTPKLVVAAVNGPAAGAGMSLALACDLRIASEQATFSQSFAQVGLYPDFGATFFLPRLVGLSRASELFYTAERLSAQDALKMGMLYGVFPAEQFDSEAVSLGQSLAAGPPIVYRDVKRAMIGEHHKELEDALDEEIRLQLHCFLTDDCAEGLAAFFEKRKPNFRGH
jgi:2-(1,2-epoxy-1,2-dihydrophenyl)acetyl-CoA isomerase